jgi:hypothetical protein
MEMEMDERTTNIFFELGLAIDFISIRHCAMVHADFHID